MESAVDLRGSRLRLPSPGVVLAWMGGLAPTLALFAYKGMAPLMLVAAVLAALPSLTRRSWPQLLMTPLGVVSVLLVAWSGLSLLWSIGPAESWNLLPRLAGVLAATLALLAVARDLEPAQRRIAADGLLIGVAVGTALIWLELLTDAAITRMALHRSTGIGALKPGATVFALLVWPMLATLLGRGRPVLAALSAAVIAVPLYLLDGKAAFLGLAVGTGVFALGALRPRLAAAAIAAVLALLSLTGPVWAPRLVHMPAVLNHVPPSGHHRLFIWNFAAERIAERPWLGWGLNTARIMPGGDTVVDPLTHGTAMPLHPHNAGLQLWLELGVPGLVLGLAFTMVVLAAIVRGLPGRSAPAAGLAAVASALVISDLSYGIWQNWWLCTFAVIAALLAITAAPDLSERSAGRA